MKKVLYLLIICALAMQCDKMQKIQILKKEKNKTEQEGKKSEKDENKPDTDKNNSGKGGDKPDAGKENQGDEGKTPEKDEKKPDTDKNNSGKGGDEGKEGDKPDAGKENQGNEGKTPEQGDEGKENEGKSPEQGNDQKNPEGENKNPDSENKNPQGPQKEEPKNNAEKLAAELDALILKEHPGLPVIKLEDLKDDNFNGAVIIPGGYAYIYFNNSNIVKVVGYHPGKDKLGAKAFEIVGSIENPNYYYDTKGNEITNRTGSNEEFIISQGIYDAYDLAIKLYQKNKEKLPKFDFSDFKKVKPSEHSDWEISKKEYTQDKVETLQLKKENSKDFYLISNEEFYNEGSHKNQYSLKYYSFFENTNIVFTEILFSEDTMNVTDEYGSFRVTISSPKSNQERFLKYYQFNTMITKEEAAKLVDLDKAYKIYEEAKKQGFDKIQQN